jgi:hypothetical protein
MQQDTVLELAAQALCNAANVKVRYVPCHAVLTSACNTAVPA